MERPARPTLITAPARWGMTQTCTHASMLASQRASSDRSGPESRAVVKLMAPPLAGHPLPVLQQQQVLTDGAAPQARQPSRAGQPPSTSLRTLSPSTASRCPSCSGSFEVTPRCNNAQMTRTPDAVRGASEGRGPTSTTGSSTSPSSTTLLLLKLDVDLRAARGRVLRLTRV
jgi:hypothetical protein